MIIVQVDTSSLSAASQPTQTNPERRRALVILFVMPLLFSSNIIFGRAAVADVEPFTLAFLRWLLTAAILMPFVYPVLVRHRDLVRRLSMQLVVMGFLGMWICGAMVYLALKYTTATNGTLIYASSPVMIILIEWLYRGRNVGWREAMGVGLALVGVIVIVAQASWHRLLSLQFNTGDLIFVGAAISWSLYSVGLRSQRLDSLQTLPLFALIASAGALLLAPFAAVEMVTQWAFPNTLRAWTNIAGIVVLASLLAFSAFQYGVKVIGPSLAGIFLYLLPVYGVSMAILFLGEQLMLFHVWGILLVISGVVLATFPSRIRQS